MDIRLVRPTYLKVPNTSMPSHREAVTDLLLTRGTILKMTLTWYEPLGFDLVIVQDIIFALVLT